MNIRWIKWLGVAASITLIGACLMTWVVVVSKNITVSGIDAEGIGFGKPGYLHIIFTIFFLAFTFIPKIWAKRWNLPITALNLAWAIRNYVLISSCSAGECPVKHAGLYLLIPISVIILVSSLFPDVPAAKVQGKKD